MMENEFLRTLENSERQKVAANQSVQVRVVEMQGATNNLT
jgi:hypothetical protein